MLRALWQRRRIPLAWLLLARQPVRLLVALAGIAFAGILMFMQLGFRDGLFEASVTVHKLFDADLVLYLAGADAHEGDRLGRLKLSDDGMRARDVVVMDWAWQRGLPLVLTMGGGYGHDIETTLRVQAATWALARTYRQRWHNRGR